VPGDPEQVHPPCLVLDDELIFKSLLSVTAQSTSKKSAASSVPA
jgi:hypothetical protein